MIYANRGGELRFQTFPTQSGDFNEINLDAVFWHQIRFHPVCCTQPANFPTLRDKMMCHGKSGENMPAGTASHHH
ncbi:hypothetical protein D3C80_1545670 [compost metagenome]